MTIIKLGAGKLYSDGVELSVKVHRLTLTVDDAQPEAHVTQAAMATLQERDPELARRVVILGGLREAHDALVPAFERAMRQLGDLGLAFDSTRRFMSMTEGDIQRDVFARAEPVNGHELARLEKKRRQAEAKTARQEQIKRRGGKR